MRIDPGAVTWLTDVAQKKEWIDLVGPMSVMLVPPVDFGAPGTGIAELPWTRVGIVRSTDPHGGDTFHDDAIDCPAAVQSSFNRNFELLYRTSTTAPGDGRVRHVYYDQASR